MALCRTCILIYKTDLSNPRTPVYFLSIYFPMQLKWRGPRHHNAICWYEVVVAIMIIDSIHLTWYRKRSYN